MPEGSTAFIVEMYQRARGLKIVLALAEVTGFGLTLHDDGLPRAIR